MGRPVRLCLLPALLALGLHLVSHDTHREWVCNGPWIDSQTVVWAHDLGPVRNRKLIDYYGGRRTIWRVNGDAQPAQWEAYK